MRADCKRCLHLAKRPVYTLAIAAWLSIMLVIAFGSFYRLPGALPESSAPSTFSGDRARRVMKEIAAPHPSGTYSLLRIQGILQGHLQAVAKDAKWISIVREDFYPNNLYAVLSGRSGGLPNNATRNTFLVNAHYDTQEITPGAQDNTAGVVVILEMFRNLVSQGQPNIPTIFLFNGDEEGGLNGITAFMEGPYAGSIGAFLNFDGREGAKSVMFRTSGSYLDDIFAKHAPLPSGSAVTDDFIHNAPVTDFYVLMGFSGLVSPPIPGFDIGFIDQPQTYHTSQDCESHVPKGALQHEGDNVLAFLMAVTQLDALPVDPVLQRRVYFDIFGSSFVSYTRTVSLILHVFFLLGTIVLGIFYSRMAAHSFKSVVVPTLVLFVSLLLGLAVSIGFGVLIQIVNPFWYDGSLILGITPIALANVATTMLLMRLYGALRARLRNEPNGTVFFDQLNHAALNMIIVLLFVGAAMAMFVNATYFLLCIAFSFNIGVSTRLILHRLKLVPAFHPNVAHAESASEEEIATETDVLINQKTPPASLWKAKHHSRHFNPSPGEMSYFDLLIEFVTFVVISSGLVMVFSGTWAGLGSTTAFPEAGPLQTPLFCALISIVALLVMVIVVPVAFQLGWTALIMTAFVLICFTIPAFAVFPLTTSEHPIRIQILQDYSNSGTISISLDPDTSRKADWNRMKQELQRLVFFASADFDKECDELKLQCTFPSVPLMNVTAPILNMTRTPVGGGKDEIRMTIGALPYSVQTYFSLLGQISQVFVDGEPYDGENKLIYSLDKRFAELKFVVGDYGSLILNPKLYIEYSPGINALMCADAALMMDSYSLQFYYPSQTYNY